MTAQRCRLCQRPAGAGTLRCDCGALFLDAVHRLPAEQADSLVASNAAWLETEHTKGARTLAQGFFIGLLPGLLSVLCIVIGDLQALMPFATATALAGLWAVHGKRRMSRARRIEAANRIALPAARIRR